MEATISVYQIIVLPRRDGDRDVYRYDSDGKPIARTGSVPDVSKAWYITAIRFVGSAGTIPHMERMGDPNGYSTPLAAYEALGAIVKDATA